ncbi:MAG: hypothetical protein FRX48_09367 [Lasallia pustulata]|uniref:Uncharacterized protein n=1 Tax=Lasallia pustulata TaxID=136370 RepID=A0A5M8PC43_9LECA|nr:MAG: hypothetical protein FRX48_09367 [Lasallia pustulata]
MKTTILVFLYAAGSLAEKLDCQFNVDAFPNCSKSRLEPTSTSSVAASETSQGHVPWVSIADGDALWTTDATDYSIYLNCTLKDSGNQTSAEIDKSQAIKEGSAIDDFGYSIGHLLPNQSATCFVSMLDEDGNLLAETPEFPAGDVGRSSTTGSALRITGAASYSTAMPLSSRFTDAATSNATVTASSSMSLSTAASSSLPLTAPSTTHGLIMTSTVFATTPAKITSSGSNPNVRVQTVMGILAGAVAFALVIGS